MGGMKFEDLDGWQMARDFVWDVYGLTRGPGIDRDFGLSGQLQRAAVSIMSSIAEGFERKHKAEKAQAYNVARASCGEARSLLYVVGDVYPEFQSDADCLRERVERVGRCITGLISSNSQRS